MTIKDDKGDQPSVGETTWTNTGNEHCTTGPNHVVSSQKNSNAHADRITAISNTATKRDLQYYE